MNVSLRTQASVCALLLVAAGCAAGGESTGPSASGAPPGPSGSPQAVGSEVASPPGCGLDLPAPAEPAGDVAVEDWAQVVMDGLRLRRCPGMSSESQGRLPAGSVGLVAAGPVEADGYTWYALAAPGIPFGSGCEMIIPDPTLLQCPAWFGWIASADLDGEPWLVATELQCPSTPTTIEEIMQITEGVTLACFGGETLRFDALIGPPGAMLCKPSYSVTPAWLDTCTFQYLSTELGPNGPQILAHLHPDVGACDIAEHAPPETCPYAGLTGRVVEVEGHVDDPAAATCEGHDLGLYPEVGPPDPAFVVYRCRLNFVLTAVRDR